MVLMLTRADKWLIGILLVVSLAGIGYSTIAYSASSSDVAEIWVNGALYQTVVLRAGYRQEFRVNVAGGYDIIEVEGRRIRVREADCPTQECVLTGWIEKAPQQIVCLPYRIVIKVVSSAPLDMDAIVH
ncbi:hypothetical protein SAMN05660235_01544 [Sporolituus thermophilus DSM 23256]|uniref:Uncharacterized protein n=2 Tax=Sporolituus TaxID=909931 RepID=A0A1G7L0D3_9FIRM|nr:hypothetical protein SAMN05660235_01544 [Sporolituus thermophilus DSM 23256]